MGEAARDAIRHEVDTAFDELPAGRTRDEQLALAAEYRALTEPRLPWLIEELDGCAEAAGVDPMAFFACSIEEIWYAPREQVTQGRCSDLVAGPAATADGHLIVGHTNDLRPAAEEEITALEISVPGDPVIFQLGGVPGSPSGSTTPASPSPGTSSPRTTSASASRGRTRCSR